MDLESQYWRRRGYGWHIAIAALIFKLFCPVAPLLPLEYTSYALRNLRLFTKRHTAHRLGRWIARFSCFMNMILKCLEKQKSWLWIWMMRQFLEALRHFRSFFKTTFWLLGLWQRFLFLKSKYIRTPKITVDHDPVLWGSSYTLISTILVNVKRRKKGLLFAKSVKTLFW